MTHLSCLTVGQDCRLAPPSCGKTTPPPPFCPRYALVQATVGVGTVLIWDFLRSFYKGGGGQLLRAADAQTAHHATFSTAPVHQLLGSANAEMTPAGAPAAAADRTQRPDATCEGKNG